MNRSPFLISWIDLVVINPYKSFESVKLFSRPDSITHSYSLLDLFQF
jgi:hypothetical protein